MFLVIVGVHLVEVHGAACCLCVHSPHLVADAFDFSLVASSLGRLELSLEVLHFGAEFFSVEIRVNLEVLDGIFGLLQPLCCVPQLISFFFQILGVEWNYKKCHNECSCNGRSPGRLENEEYQRKYKSANRDKKRPFEIHEVKACSGKKT